MGGGLPGGNDVDRVVFRRENMGDAAGFFGLLPGQARENDRYFAMANARPSTLAPIDEVEVVTLAGLGIGPGLGAPSVTPSWC
jgi:hypothetical protein